MSYAQLFLILRLETILSFGDIALKMKSKPGKRIKQFTGDTAYSIHHTCYRMVELCKTLLYDSHKYVMLGQFTSDSLENEFGKLRQGSGGTYFITVQQIVEKCNISKASLPLRQSIELTDIDFDSDHSCEDCNYHLDEFESKIFDELPNLESSASDDTIMGLIYVSGYLTRNEKEQSEGNLLQHATLYHQKYFCYADSMVV